MYSCRNCNVAYKHRPSLYRHMKQCKVSSSCAKGNLPNGPTNTESSSEVNTDCSRTDLSSCQPFSEKKHLELNKIESIGKSGEESTECSGTKPSSKHQARMRCFANGCNKIFFRSGSLLCHLEQEHSDEPELIQNIQDKYEALTFENLASFFKWKEEVEISTHSYFSKQTGKRRCGDGSYTYSHYICQHDGTAEPHVRGERPRTGRKRKMGRVKLGNMCLARMYVKQDNATGIVMVRYVSAHQLTHTPSYEDTKHHPIPNSKRELIKKQLSIGIPGKDIHSAFTENAGDRERGSDGALPQKGDVVSLSVIRSIDRTLKSQARIHPDDATAVLLLVEQLQAETYDPILVYKPQGGGGVVGDPGIDELEDQENLFMLGFQTKQQWDVLNRSSMACMDWTHKTNQYDFRLFTMVVQDDFGRGCPVAHFICNRTDEKVLRFFFNALKLRCLNLALNSVITDDDPAIWKAFVSGFFSLNLGEADTQNDDELGQIATKHLLCHWNVHRNWLRCLRQKVSDWSLEQEMYIALRIILYCKDVKEFEERSVGFCEKYRHSAPTFVSYFESNYLNRAEIWASCFRIFPYEICNTNMLVESFHSRHLKRFFMRCVSAKKRLDDLINMLLDIEKHDDCRRKGTMDLDMPTVENCLTNEDRHRMGISIPDDDVISCGSSKWEVKSQRVPSLLHTVTEVSGYNCSKDICFERCIEIACVGLCQHSYKCSCSDHSPICKHIHKVHSLEMSKFATANAASGEEMRLLDYHDETRDDEMIICCPEITLAEPGELVQKSSTDSQRQVDSDNKQMLDRIRNNISELENRMNSEQVKRLLTHVDGLLGNLVFQCRATEIMPLSVKMEEQVHF